MVTLQGSEIFLRALEPEDLTLLYALENDETLWELSSTQTPFSKFILKQYLENSHRDIYEVKQLRLVICKNQTSQAIGFIDLFDFNPQHQRAGVGIVVFSKENLQKGYASQALQLVINYGKKHLNLHQLFANILSDNTASIKLFEKKGFVKTGEKKDWIFTNKTYKTEYFYQYIYE